MDLKIVFIATIWSYSPMPEVGKIEIKYQSPHAYQTMADCKIGGELFKQGYLKKSREGYNGGMKEHVKIVCKYVDMDKKKKFDDKIQKEYGNRPPMPSLGGGRSSGPRNHDSLHIVPHPFKTY